jgi:hypothetical protein
MALIDELISVTKNKNFLATASPGVKNILYWTYGVHSTLICQGSSPAKLAICRPMKMLRGICYGRRVRCF